MDDIAPWDSIASEVHDRIGTDGAVDPIFVAYALGLRVVVSSRIERASVIERTIIVPDGQRRERTGFSVLHEVAHLLLRTRGIEDSEPACDALAAALLLPRRALDRDLRSTWALPDLRERHPHASHEAIARRILALREAVVVVADRAPARRWKRLRSASLDLRLSIARRIERDLVDAADQSGEPEGPSDLVRAWPLRDGGARRVVLIAQADELEHAAR